MRGWQGQPRKMVEYEHRRKKQRKGRSSGCRLQVGDAENDLLARHRIESPKRPPKSSTQGRLPQSINVEIRTELEKRVLYALWGKPL